MASLLVFLMAGQEKDPEEILLDVRDANLRHYAGCTVQTIPKAWLRRMDLQAFFSSDLELALVRVDGKLHIEIRRK
jgi:hypothetical protein